jgi:hypothetical protein
MRAGLTDMTLRQQKSSQWKSPKRKEDEQQSQEHANLFLTLAAHKDFVLAGQSFPHTTVTLYVECVKTCMDFAPNFGSKRTGSRITKQRLAHHFSPGNL